MMLRIGFVLNYVAVLELYLDIFVLLVKEEHKMRRGDEYIPNRTGDVIDNAYHETEYERGYNEGYRDGTKAEKERQKSAAKAAKGEKK